LTVPSRRTSRRCSPLSADAQRVRVGLHHPVQWYGPPGPRVSGQHIVCRAHGRTSKVSRRPPPPSRCRPA
jgi:hypothetical protein